MEYWTVKEAGEKWGITAGMVNYYCSDGRIKGAVKKGNLWLIPDNSKKPFDGRSKAGKRSTVSLNGKEGSSVENVLLKYLETNGTKKSLAEWAIRFFHKKDYPKGSTILEMGENTPSEYWIEALEDCVLAEISVDDLRKLIDTKPEFQTLL